MKRSSVAALVTLLALAACETSKAPTDVGKPPEPPKAAMNGGKVSEPVKAPVAAKAKSTSKLVGPAADAMKGVDFPGVHNVVAFSPGLYSGSVPEGDAGFQSLEDLGVKTIISVDGSVPEVAEAKAHGMRYVHLPVGYNGVSEERTLEIARAIRDLPGPVYLHCHHGKHRSAGALGAAVVTLGKLSPDEATARMKVSGTAANYTGLYACVADAEPASAAKLDKAPSTFPEVTMPKGMVPTMVAIDMDFDSLKAIQKAGWKAPKDHPDLVPAKVAANLENNFRHLSEDKSLDGKPADFHGWLDGTAEAANEIEAQLLSSAPSTEKMEASFKLLNDTCKQCHTKYRD